MSSELIRPSDNRKKKELKVLELHDRGYSYRKIAEDVHLSLRDVTKYIHRVSSKTKSPSTISVMDEVVLEYRVNGLRHEVRDLEIRKANLNNELTNLCAQITNLEDQELGKQSETQKIIIERIHEILHDKELMFFTSFFAITEALRNYPDIKLLLFDLVMSQDIVCGSELTGKPIGKHLKDHQFVVAYYNQLKPLYQEYLTKIMEIIYVELMRSYQLMLVKV
jgi:hypothetical protein